MESRKYKSLKNKIRSQAGETLVEAIISIAIFLIAMAGITGIVKTATNINMEARQLSQEIEKAGTRVEMNESDSQEDGQMNIIIDNEIICQDITIKKADSFSYFTPK